MLFDRRWWKSYSTEDGGSYFLQKDVLVIFDRRWWKLYLTEGGGNDIRQKVVEVIFDRRWRKFYIRGLAYSYFFSSPEQTTLSGQGYWHTVSRLLVAAVTLPSQLPNPSHPVCLSEKSGYL